METERLALMLKVIGLHSSVFKPSGCLFVSCIALTHSVAFRAAVGPSAMLDFKVYRYKPVLKPRLCLHATDSLI